LNTRLKRIQLVALRVERRRTEMRFWAAMRERLEDEGKGVEDSDYRRVLHFLDATRAIYHAAYEELCSIRHEQSIMLRSGRARVRP